MMHNGEEKEKTLVMWDMSSCPIPDGFDPRLVGRRIESALRNSGYSGPLTISAFGDLTEKIHDENDVVLPGLSSTGIALNHGPEIVSDLYWWIRSNPPPAAIMLISNSSILGNVAITLGYIKKRKYRILLAYPQGDPSLDHILEKHLQGDFKAWLWETLLEEAEIDSGARLVPQDSYGATAESPWYYCQVCQFEGKSFENFTTHLKSVEHESCELNHVAAPPPNVYTIKPSNSLHAQETVLEDGPFTMTINLLPKTLVDPKTLKDKCHKDEMMIQYKEEEMKTLVCWDMNSCPIPDGFDPSLVGPRIESALMISGYYCHPDPLTITAFADLTQVPAGDNVMQQLSSSGIAIKHAVGTHEVETYLLEWARCNPPPSLANIMLISGLHQVECLADVVFNLGDLGYKTFLAYPRREPALRWLRKTHLYCVYETWLWKNLLKETVDRKQLARQVQASKKLEHASSENLKKKLKRRCEHDEEDVAVVLL